VNTAATPPDRYALMGHPVSHSWSPFIHGMFARATQQNMQYRLVDVAPEKFRGEAVQFFLDGGKGLNITVPHKEAAAALVNELTPRAALARAVNTVHLKGVTALVGDNTDGTGLVIDLEQNLGIEIAGRRVLVLGAGGATRGILGPLLERRPVAIAIANRTPQRAFELAQDFAGLAPLAPSGFDDIEGVGFDLVINATAASLQGAVPEIPPAIIGPTSICYDTAYAKGDTPFTRWAREHGAAQAFKGWGMLVEQAAEAFLVWRGVRPETRPILELLNSPTRR
jgi:shikimate dehydrogenase